MVDLLEHNQKAFQEINKMIKSGIKKIAVPRATGSGKTYLMGALAEKYNNDKKLVLEPTRPLLNSIEEKFDEFGITNTDFITYQKLIRMSDEDIAAMNYKLIFLDECHHGTAPIWGQKIDYLMNTHSDSIIFGTSATTVRNDGVNVVETIFEGNTVGELPLSTAIARKVLPCPHYITAIYRVDNEFEKLKKRIEASTNSEEEKKEFYEKMKFMKTHFEKSYGVPTILNKYIKVKNGRYLVFCKDKNHLDAMRPIVVDWFQTAGIKNIHSYAVYSDYPDKEKDYKGFCEDNSNSCKVLFSINMLNEGLHISDISGVLMLRTTQSNLIYLQQLGRLVDADNIDKYLLVFDFVNNFSSVNDGIGLLREIKDAVAREKENDPDFDDNGFEDIDTFFVLENVVEIQEMFKEIEGRLTGREWTEEENNILKEYYLIEGTKVGERLKGRTKVAVKRQARILGLNINICNPWTEAEIEILRKYYPMEGLKVIDRLEGRTDKAILSKARKLSLQLLGKWNDKEIELLKKYYPIEGIKVKNRLEGRTESSILAKVSKLKIQAPKKWTDEEYQILYKYYPIEGEKVKDRLNNKTEAAIYSKVGRLGIKVCDKSWTGEEVEILKKWYPVEGSKVIDKLSGRTKGAIATQASMLGLEYRNGKKYKYVYNEKNRYVVSFSVNGKNMRFGTFDSEEEAAKVAMEKAKEYGKAI